MRVYLSLLVFLTIQTLSSQDFIYSKRKLINNGESSTIRKFLTIDEEGFIWYNTNNAIVKYTGAIDIIYEIPKPKFEDAFNIHYKVNSLEYHLKKIYILTSIGFCVFDTESGDKKWYFSYHENENRKYIGFSKMKKDEDGNLWFETSSDNLFFFNVKKKNLHKYKLRENVRKKYAFRALINIPRLIEIQKDKIFYEQNNNLYFFDKELKTSKLLKKKISNLNVNNAVSNYSFKGLFLKLAKNKLNGNYKLKDNNYNYSFLPLLDVYYFELPYEKVKVLSSRDKQNKRSIIIAVALGKKVTLLKFDIKKNNISVSILREYEFKNNIAGFLVDKFNQLWITSGDELCVIKNKRVLFKTYLTNREKIVSTRQIVEGKKGFYAATYDGIYYKNKNEKKFNKTRFKIKRFGEIDNRFSWITNLLWLNEEELIVSGHNNIIEKLNIVTGELSMIGIIKGVKINVHVIDMLLLDEDTLLLGTNNGIYELDLKEKDFVELKNTSERFKKLNLENKEIRDILLDSEKNIWIGTAKFGLFKMKENGNVIHYSTESKHNYRLINNEVNVIYETKDNEIWIGTSGGLQKIGNDSTKFFSEFKNNYITGILEDDEGKLWVATYEGLLKVDKSKGLMNAFFTENGLPFNEFNKKAFLKTENGKLFFGGINGYISFDPKNMKFNTKKAKIFLTEIKKGDKNSSREISIKYKLSEIKEVKIPFSKNYIKFFFAVDEFFENEHNKYFYKIKKVRNKWVEFNNRGELELLGMSPGNYTLEVKGLSAKGNQTNVLKYNIIVENAFYNKNWFRITTVVVVFLFLLFRYRTIKDRDRLKGKLVELEIKALRNQMNPHFVFNVLNSIQSKILLEKNKFDLEKYIQSFSKLIRYQLDSINVKWVNLKEEINFLKDYIYLQNVCYNKDIILEILISKDLVIEETYVLPAFFQPIVENAFLHGLFSKKEGEKKLSVSFTKEGSFLKCSFKDNGVGISESSKERKKEKLHKSWASIIMNERVRVFNMIYKNKMKFTIKNVDEKETGTLVEVFIPLELK